MFPFLVRERYHNIDANYKLTLIRFVFSLGVAAAGTTWSLYMHHIGFSNSEIGYITGIAVLLSLAVSLANTPILELFRPRRVLVFSLFLYAVSYLLIAFSTNHVLFIVVAGVIAMTTALRKGSFAILFRDTVSREQLPQREGLMFALANLGWFVMPVFAGLVLARYGFTTIFLMTVVMFTVSILMLLFSDMLYARKKFKHIDGNIIRNIKQYLKRTEMLYPYAIRFGMNVINGFVVIYLPIFLFEKGISPVYIGAMISTMALVHALFEFKIGRIAEHHTLKPFFIFGFLMMSVLLIGANFVQNPYILMTLIPLAGVATLFIEPLQDTFFFSLVRKAEDEERLYPVYSTANQLGGFVAKALPATVLLFAPERFAYLSVAFVLVGIVYMISHMNEVEMYKLAV